MELPLESAVRLEVDGKGLVAGHSLDDWNSAYAKVESYFCALGVRNKLLLGQLVSRVLDRAIHRAQVEPLGSASQLATEEMDRVVTEWFTAVLAAPVGAMLSERGRLGLMLADMPGRWQSEFLEPGPWPEDFVRSMRETFLRAGPDFHLSQMSPRPIDLGPIAALTNLGNFGYFRAIVLWSAFAWLLVVLFRATH
jgi:hypothetical protein